MSSDFTTIIIGAGVVGLAIAREMAMAGDDVLVLERHGVVGSETSARNSGVIHAGIYYPPGSLKARLCVEGKKRLYDYCRSHAVPHANLGKLIVATSPDQVRELENIAARARANGVDDLRLLSRAEAQAMEPQLECEAALHSPSTGIVDIHSYMLALQGDAESHGAQFAFNTPVARWEAGFDGGFKITCADEEETVVSCEKLIISAGLSASKVAAASQSPATHPQETLYAKGNYFRLDGKAPFSRLIYPVPEPGGLGVHITLDLGGQARFGPDVEWVDEIDYRVDASRGDAFYREIRRYWPGLEDGALQPDYAGIRPKLVGPGEPNADFVFWTADEHGIPGLVALLGIESPGLTSSLAIARHVRSAL